MKHSAIIVNHRVALPGTAAHRSTSGHALKYNATRPGVDMEPTRDDILKYERQKNLGYIAHREGAVPEPGTNCALFDQHGVADYNSVRKQLAANKGGAILSVVSVKREDAELLGLASKEDFQKLLRSEWSKHLEELGIPRQSARWVGAYHRNSSKNWHCHLISWSENGEFNSLIPKRTLEQARSRFVYKAMEPARQRVSMARTQARDDLVKAIKEKPIPRRHTKQADSIREALPHKGSLKYANLAKAGQSHLLQKVDSLVEARIGEDPSLCEKRARWRAAVEQHADLKGLTGEARKSHIAAAESDLVRRLGNAQIGQIRELSAPQVETLQTDPGINLTNAFYQIASAIGSGSPYRRTTRPQSATPQPDKHKHKHKPSLSPKKMGPQKGMML